MNKINFLKLDGRKTFSLLTGINREVLPAQITKLADSITKMGIIRPVVVCTVDFINGKPTTYILDGQHLFHACIRNKVDIPYVYVTVKDMQDLVEKIALLNSSSKSWTSTDYILAWSAIKEDYKKLMHYSNIYSLETVELASILMGIAIGGGATKAIRLGNFEVKQEKAATRMIECLTDVLKIVNIKNKRIIRTFMGAYVNYYKKLSISYDHDAFIKFCKSNTSRFDTCTTDQEYNNVFYRHKRI